MAKVQLYEYENQTFEGFVAASRMFGKSDCPVARRNLLVLATAHDCETGLLLIQLLIRLFTALL